MAQDDTTHRDNATTLTEGLRQLPGKVDSAVERVESIVAADLQPPIFERLEEFMPAADLFFGGAMLLIIVLVHATGLRLVTSRFERRMALLRVRPSTWRPDLYMLASVVLLLIVHLSEIFIWAAALVGFGLVPNWRVAGFVAANTYTAVGYGSFEVPQSWQMLQPFLALSGLFTIGWSVSVLVEIVRGSHEIKTEAYKAKLAQTRRQRAGPQDPPAA